MDFVQTAFSRMFVWQTILKDGNSISRWNKEQICLLSTIMKIMSSSRAKVGQVCLQNLVMDLVFLNSRLLSCNANLSTHPLVSFFTSLGRLWGKVIKDKNTKSNMKFILPSVL